MSSFPKHVDNIKSLKRIGFDVSDCFDSDGTVSLDSWNYDELVYLMGEIISKLDGDNYKVTNL